VSRRTSSAVNRGTQPASCSARVGPRITGWPTAGALTREPRVPASGTERPGLGRDHRAYHADGQRIRREREPSWLNPLDALLVDAQDTDPHTSMAIASIAVFEGPAPSHEEFLAHMAGRLARVPRYRQKLRTVPFRPRAAGLGRRPGLRSGLPRAPHRAACSRRRPRTGRPDGAGDVAATGP